MKVLMLLLWSFIPPESGYVIDGDNVVFYYSGEGRNVLVSGNFNKWSKDDDKWTMKFDPDSKTWKLTAPKKEIVKNISGSFYEFTFRVDGVLIDADKNNKSVIHCQGYGYRYVIEGI
ncbi:MAG TPA: hypothetical protein VK589_06680 [Chryseolinea sp.]|nr:hypothetical protein [Chryseolinea sp.]